MSEVNALEVLKNILEGVEKVSIMNDQIKSLSEEKDNLLLNIKLDVDLLMRNEWVKESNTDNNTDNSSVINKPAIDFNDIYGEFDRFFEVQADKLEKNNK